MDQEKETDLSSIIKALINSGAEFSLSSETQEKDETAATHKLFMRGKDGIHEWRLTAKEDWPVFHSDLAKTMRDCDVKAGRWKFFSAYHFVNEIAELGPGESLPKELRKLTRSIKMV